ncbi:hypothetical protein BACCAP_02669 [Pseudoflavonifractor capillosus ATCC 29799]|uniref:Uncharacterized protein n=1 Tax=Pseudoflavonifractor capillosus ATCC 29799 TaxID=411467 RepID=A6NWS4_9FIRM|nr:hypothetical protein BACCAP_02669 [Pseudoflavonifractor capillosus ATCC 29799]
MEEQGQTAQQTQYVANFHSLSPYSLHTIVFSGRPGKKKKSTARLPNIRNAGYTLEFSYLSLRQLMQAPE